LFPNNNKGALGTLKVGKRGKGFEKIFRESKGAKFLAKGFFAGKKDPN